MFIISNYKKKQPFTISTKNNLKVLESHEDNITYHSTENNSPVNYFVVKSQVDSEKEESSKVFHREMLIPSKLFIVETIYEKPQNNIIEPKDALLDLITDFGDKKTKNRIKKKDIITYVSKQSITFNIETQILPDFDKENPDPRKVYSLKLLLKNDTFSNLEKYSNEIQINDANLSSFVTNYIQTFVDTEENKECLILALDCYYKMLNEKLVTERTFGNLKFFYDEVKAELINGRIPQLFRDKILVKFYILLLILSGFELNFDQLPRFGQSQNKISSLLKIIGCNITKNGLVKLELLPKDSFAIKKLKS